MITQKTSGMKVKIFTLAALSARFVLCVLMLTHSTTEAAADTSKVRVLVFSKTNGFRHDSIAACQDMFRDFATTDDPFEFDFTEDSSQFLKLGPYTVVVFASTTGSVLSPGELAAFRSYIEGGHGGFLGIHSAADTLHGSPWYLALVGAEFIDHPQVQEAVIHVVVGSASTAMLPRIWTRTDEWYNFKMSVADKSNYTVLATIDESTYQGGGMGAVHPIAWQHESMGARAWYTAGGHTATSFREPLFRAHILGGLQWVAGIEGRTSDSATRDNDGAGGSEPPAAAHTRKSGGEFDQSLSPVTLLLATIATALLD
jgi:type 1 glutamine amidotransferase